MLSKAERERISIRVDANEGEMSFDDFGALLDTCDQLEAERDAAIEALAKVGRRIFSATSHYMPDGPDSPIIIEPLAPPEPEGDNL